MSSIRLTNYMREQICGRAIAAKFEPLFAGLDAEEASMGLRFYEHVIPLAERKMIAKIPERWVRLDACLRFNVGGMNLKFKVDPAVRVPLNEGYCKPLGSITDQADVDAARRIFDRRDELKAERKRASNVLSSLLSSFTTAKVMTESWPEGSAFYADLKTPDSNLPAPIIYDINVMLGLAEAA